MGGPTIRYAELRGIDAALRDAGVAIRHFPHYVNRAVDLHNPRVVLLSFIVSGRGQHVLGDEVYEEDGGSIGITHYEQLHDVVTDADGMEIYNIFVDPEHYPLPPLPEPLADVLPEILPLHPCFQHRLNRMVRLELDAPECFRGHAAAMLHEQETREPGYRAAIRHHFTLFLMAACRQALRSGMPLETPRGQRNAAWLERLRRFIDKEYAQAHTLPELAERAGVSAGYLCRAFKAYTGKTVFDYLLHRRVQAAMLRLRQSDETVMAIALDCGFNDLSYFNRKFRALTGMTPTEYRG